ncbi:MAG: hypothetical protein GWP74_19210 [Proteobacteria bacterium]|nr:hypothetical protein [Pseudomonadota bacterium]
MAEKDADLSVDVDVAAAIGQLVISSIIQGLSSHAGSMAGVTQSSGGATTELEHVSSVQAVEAMRTSVAGLVSTAMADIDARSKQAQAEARRVNAYADTAMGLALLGAVPGGDIDGAKKLVDAALAAKA